MKTYYFDSIEGDFEYEASSHIVDDKGWVTLYKHVPNSNVSAIVAVIKIWSRFEIK